MVKKIVQAIALGLFCAFLIIFVSPLLKDRSATVNGKTTHIESYHDAVQLASPAVVNVYNHAFSQDGKTLK